MQDRQVERRPGLEMVLHPRDGEFHVVVPNVTGPGYPIRRWPKGPEHAGQARGHRPATPRPAATCGGRAPRARPAPPPGRRGHSPPPGAGAARAPIVRRCGWPLGPSLRQGQSDRPTHHWSVVFRSFGECVGRGLPRLSRNVGAGPDLRLKVDPELFCGLLLKIGDGDVLHHAKRRAPNLQSSAFCLLPDRI